MSGRDFATRHILFYLIIKELSATTYGLSQKSVDRFTSRNNRNNFPCNSVFGETEEYALWRGCCRHRRQTQSKVASTVALKDPLVS